MDTSDKDPAIRGDLSARDTTDNDVISIADGGELENYDYISAAEITACRAYVARRKAANCHSLVDQLAR